MGNTRKVQWAGIVALVVVILAVMAVIGVQRAGQRAEAAEAHDAYAQQLQTEQVEREAREKAEAEAAAQQSAEAIAQRTEHARNILNGGNDVVISVLGDSTGNETGEWVGLWAQDLAADGAAVTMHQWDWEQAVWLDSPVIIGNGSRQVTIWNGSQPGATAAYPMENPAMLPESADLVLTSYGHNGTAPTAKSSLADLLDATADKWDNPPTVVTVQNPATGDAASNSAANHEAVRELAADRDLPVIDVNKAFAETADPTALLLDDVHPNPEGSQVWVDAVTSFFD